MNVTCSKVYKDIPFAHRQPRHDGHCAWLHGHNWSFKFTFESHEVDENGFIVDFGKLQFIKDILNKFDHALVIPDYDPKLETFRDLHQQGLCNLIVLPDASCEGLVKYFLLEVNETLQREFEAGRLPHEVFCTQLEIWEDEKNSTSATLNLPKAIL